MIEIVRETSANRVNAILNDPAVRPWVADMAEGQIDISESVENQNNVLLMGEHGGCMMLKLMPGIYEVHTQVLPAGRGPWAHDFTVGVARWMFLRTDAYELLTKVPKGHVAAKAATLAAGGRYEFTRPNGCRFRGRSTDVDIYALRLQEWAATAPDMVERGAWFHEFLNAEAKRLGVTDPTHSDDENHNRYVGVSLEMALAGQVRKAVLFYNRWGLVSRHRLVQFVSDDPPMIKFDLGILRIKQDGKLEVVREC